MTVEKKTNYGSITVSEEAVATLAGGVITECYGVVGMASRKALNVFPVPDGDTGTNMSLTFNNGIAEVKKSGSEQLSVVAKTLSRGLLMGARGNSGVILSQIFRGFQQYVGDKEELTVKEFAEAMLNGAKLAYKAVMRPVEGTILTVVRESAQAGLNKIKEYS